VVSRGGLLLLAALLPSAARHPTHASSAELTCGGDSVHVTIRMFADDASEAGPIRAQVLPRFSLADRRGAAIELGWMGAEPAGDVVIVRLGGRAPLGLAGATVANQILTDRFADQVNVVRAACAGRPATLVFTRGDGPKGLP
jgi:hypothetical protein